ncbi:pyruvate kinase [Vibrio genomosp. F10]|uniref:pyruvate kinase n=1 Tax=Vibrio genomosp. F10 TaxID=723171 RepID=UPI0002D32129|nr:pyruvate kinase [Vibrio genomosp. F10]OEF03703.1 pyruvate kinase [Vibrio genomosp. F10 str. 9ZB36]
MNKTKIVATLGPASQDAETLTKMIKAGVNVVRLNFSHGNQEDHIATALKVRTIAKQLGKYVGILVDLQGPKIRISGFESDSIYLNQGDTFYLDGKLAPNAGTQHSVGLDYPQLIQDLEPGNILLLDDGRVQLETLSVDTVTQKVETRALNGGKLSNRKGINLLGGGLSAPALTTKDKQDIATAAVIDADFLAVSFPRNADDLHDARAIAVRSGCNAQIVAKIERAEIVTDADSMDKVIAASDIIMVARGDLGVEIGDARLPSVQKMLISRAKHLGKPVITATQMMESMIENPLPTRAEVMDVANAIIDGTDAIMLSGESAMGCYPVEAVEAMVRVAEGVETESLCADACWQKIQQLCSDNSKSFAISSMISAARSEQALGVAVYTESGETPLLMSRCQSQAVIWALSNDEKLLARMSILRGVEAIYLNTTHSSSDDTSIIVPLLSRELEKRNISSLLISRFESVENVGDINISQLIQIKPSTCITAC